VHAAAIGETAVRPARTATQANADATRGAPAEVDKAPERVEANKAPDKAVDKPAEATKAADKVEATKAADKSTAEPAKGAGAGAAKSGTPGRTGAGNGTNVHEVIHFGGHKK
jgi:hypothetical protein